MAWRSIVVLLAVNSLSACGVDYPRTVAERVRAHGNGSATVAELFGEAERTCIAVGSRDEIFEGLDPPTRNALRVPFSDYNTVVVAQFDRHGRVMQRWDFHFRNPHLYLDVENGIAGEVVRCFGPSTNLDVEAYETHAKVRI